MTKLGTKPKSSMTHIRNPSLKTGAIVIYLPAYSPDYNPIEKVFSQVKKWLINKGGVYLDSVKVIDDALESITMHSIKGHI